MSVGVQVIGIRQKNIVCLHQHQNSHALKSGAP